MKKLPAKPFQYQLWIDGKEEPSKSGKTFDRCSPAHDVVVGVYPLAGNEETDLAVKAARRAFDQGPWPKRSGAERASCLSKLASLIRKHADDLAFIETLESGKPIAQARNEMEWAAGIWDYAAASCRNIAGDTYNSLGEQMLGLVVREPIGVVGMITPWNFPLLIISQKLPFALGAGCTCVVKPSELTPGTTLRLGPLLAEAGVPDGVVNILSGYGDPVGARLSANPDVDMLSFTGSTEIGKAVVAASRSNLKKVGLELGGKNPQIIFADADWEAALDAAVFGLCFNMGECCNSGSRLIVERSIYDRFTECLADLIGEVKVGDPLDDSTQVGAIVNDEQLNKILRYITDGRKCGATLRVGGQQLKGTSGRFVEPTIFSDVRPDMAIAREEIFGPVLSILPFDHCDEAIAIANSTPYGLSASVWTRDLDRAFAVSRGVRAGTVWINTFMEGPAELPFGGYKESGLGRELGRSAIEEFTDLKTIQVHFGLRTSWWVQPRGRRTT
jgi:acyl-CoA reductase-like NAD-dependent aldehyde dehydrogenase